MAQIVDVAQTLDEQKTRPVHFAIALMAFLMLFLDGVDNQGLGFAAPAITKAWGLSRGAFGPIFTAGVTGVALGALIVGPLADRFGRKPMTIGTTIFFGVLTLAVSQATNVTELSVLRFLAGLGLGTLVPMAVVVATEFAPRRTRGRLVTMACCGYAIGAAAGGQLAAQIIPLYGWQSLFYVGGFLPLVLALAMVVWLPESVRLLALRPGNNASIIRTLRRINTDLTFAPDVQFIVANERTEKKLRVFQLFTKGRTAITLLLWVILFLNTIVLNLLNNWLPSLVATTGLPQDQALRIASMLSFGGFVGVLGMGVFVDRFGFFRVLAVGFFIGGIAVGLVGLVGTNVALLVAVITVAGFCNIGCQITDAVMAAALYPTDIRSTGVNWAHGAARVFATVGPLIGGMLLELQTPLRDIFLIFAVPLLIASGCVLTLSMLVKRRALRYGEMPLLAKHAVAKATA